MGTEVVTAVGAAEDLELVAVVDDGDRLSDVADAGAQVVVDFTRPDVVMDDIRFCVDHDIHCVVGTTGFDEQRLATVAGWLEPKPGIGVVIAPNFGIGAILLMRFAQEAARFFPSTEIVELHHPHKVDAPSGPPCAPPGWWRPPAGRPRCPRRRTRRPTSSPALAEPTSRGSPCTPSGSRGWWPTRRSSWVRRGRRSPCATTPTTAPRSCPASCWRCAASASGRGSPSGLEPFLGF
jgi:hypothetical protein